jgi:hypothetical protein
LFFRFGFSRHSYARNGVFQRDNRIH